MRGRSRGRDAAWLAWCLVPFTVLFCESRWELALGAVGWALLCVPGLLAMTRWLPAVHPFRRFPAPLAVAPTFGLLLFGVIAAVATKMHWRFPVFLWTFGAVYFTTCLSLRFWPRPVREQIEIESKPVNAPGFPTENWFGWLMLAGLVLTMVAVCLGRSSAGDPSWTWTGLGFCSGVFVFLVAAVRRGKWVEPIDGTPRVSPTEGETDERLDLGLACVLWVCAALLGLHLMLVAYESKHPGPDDVTHVGRAVDFLTGEPMDRYEPSLGEELPMDSEYLIATQSLLLATFSRLTGISSAALQHGVLPPLMVLAGIAAWITLIGLLLRRHRILWPLATLLLLATMLFSDDGHRSLAQFLFSRPTLPKSIYLVLIMPLQVASMVLVMTRPSGVNAGLAALLAFAGYLLHPWSVIAGAVWAGSFLLLALLHERSALRPIMWVLAAFVGLGLLHLALSLLPGGAAFPSETPDWNVELMPLVDGSFALTLNPTETIGRYTFFRLGVLALPWIALLGLRMREFRPMVVVGVVVLGFAYFEPMGRLMAVAVPKALLWRTRWMFPSAIGVVSLTACFVWAVLPVLSSLHVPMKARYWVAVLATCGAFGGMLWNTGSSWIPRDGPVARLSKFQETTHQIVEAMGGVDSAPFLLAPSPSPLAHQIPQLVPRSRFIATRSLIVRWFLGKEEADRRFFLIASFYDGRMKPRGFNDLLDEFPVDWVAVDHDIPSVASQVGLLRNAGWSPHVRVGRYELWRARLADGIHPPLLR